MLYVENGHKNDMYFVKQKTIGYQDKIVKVFYSMINAHGYVNKYQRIGERNEHV